LAAISFNACDNDEFKQMCEAIGQFGPGLEPPTQDSLREIAGRRICKNQELAAKT